MQCENSMVKVHIIEPESKDSIAKTAHNAYVTSNSPCPPHRMYVDFERFLYLEATGLSATTTPLELAALRLSERLLVLVRAHSKVLH